MPGPQSLRRWPSVFLLLLWIFTVSVNVAAAQATNQQLPDRRITRMATSPSPNPQPAPRSGGEQVHPSQQTTRTSSRKLPAYRDDQITVESRKENNNQIELSITSGHGQKDVPLPQGFRTYNFRRYADRLIVFGWIAHGSQVVIINLDNSTIGDSFLADKPVISPDGRFIAFVKWFPPHLTLGPDREDHEMLYDMTKSALGNRPTGVAPNDDINVGLDVYPGNGNKDGDNYHVPEPLVHRVASWPFWSPDSRKLVFAVEVQSSLKLVFVQVLGPSTGATPSTSILSLDKAGLCPAAPWLYNHCDISMVQVKFLENGLDAFFAKNALGPDARFKNGSLSRELQVNYADFVPLR